MTDVADHAAPRTTEYIVTAWVEQARGPGWSGHTAWVLLFDVTDGRYRLVGLQPEEWTPAMAHVAEVSVAAHEAMTAAAKRWAEGKR